jgi:hypothetical protein
VGEDISTGVGAMVCERWTEKAGCDRRMGPGKRGPWNGIWGKRRRGSAVGFGPWSCIISLAAYRLFTLAVGRERGVTVFRRICRVESKRESRHVSLQRPISRGRWGSFSHVRQACRHPTGSHLSCSPNTFFLAMSQIFTTTQTSSR